MRVLMTTDTVGGVWTFTQELSLGLLNKGCAVALVSLGRKPAPAQAAWAQQQVVRWGSRFRYEPLDAALEWMTDNSRAFAQAAPTLARIANDFKADLLLSSQYCFGAVDCDIPRAIVAHSDVLSWAEACRPDGLHASRWLDTYRNLVQQGLEHADAVIAPTQWMLDALARNFKVSADRHVIPNGRTLSSLLPEVPRKLQAITAGRLWDEAKDIKMLETVDSPIPLMIAGETEHESAILSMAGSDFHLLGALDESDMLRLFQQSAIYICTSRYEPFGLAPLEAALCGCAVLANDIPSLREVWEDSALYFTGPESLSSWLWRLSDHPWLLRESQEFAASRACEFTTERMINGYLQLFRSMLNQSSLVATHVA